MRITIKAFEQCNTDVFVTFDTKIGVGKAKWNSSRYIPEIGKVFQAEFDIDCSMEKNINSFSSSKNYFGMVYQDNQMNLFGVIESIDPDMMGFFRLSTDCLIMLEIKSEEICVGEWYVLKIDLMEFSISVYN